MIILNDETVSSNNKLLSVDMTEDIFFQFVSFCSNYFSPKIEKIIIIMSSFFIFIYLLLIFFLNLSHVCYYVYFNIIDFPNFKNF